MNFKSVFKRIFESIPPIHKEGYRFIFIFGIISLLLRIISPPFGFIGLIVTIWCAYFFRDPDRVTPIDDDYIVSPADGLVQEIKKVPPPAELGLGEDRVVRVSVFLNIFNVHVNRVPVTGQVVALKYHSGKFLSADLNKASSENERQSVVIKTKNGHQVICVQIAGFIARRIVCYLKDAQAVQTGERYGLIRFGSRVDIYLPVGVNPRVIEGQTVIGGETLIADMKDKSIIVKGETR